MKRDSTSMYEASEVITVKCADSLTQKLGNTCQRLKYVVQWVEFGGRHVFSMVQDLRPGRLELPSGQARKWRESDGNM